MAIDDLYRCAVRYRIHGQSNVNVFYLKNESAATDETAGEVAEAILPSFGAAYQKCIPYQAHNFTYDVEVSKISRIFSEQGAFTLIMPDATAIVPGQSLPSVNAVTMSITTGLSGPTRRGRVFLGGVAISSVQASVLIADGYTRYNWWEQEIAGAFMGATPSTGFRLGVFSRKRYSLLSNPLDEYWKPATQLQVRAEIGTMKSRKVGVGA